jgi:Major Facilitator Superfamily
VLAIVAFVAWESRANEPMLDLGFFSDPRFSAAIAAVMALFFGLFALMFISTQELQSVMGYDPFAAGVRLVPLPALFVVFAQVSVRLAGRVGTRLVVTAGLAIAAGLATGATLDAGSGYGVLALALSLTGIGMGCTMAPATASIMDGAPRERAAVAAAVNDTTRLTAGAIGVAVVGSLVSAAYSQAFAGQAATLPADAVAQAETSIASTARVAQQAGGRTGEQILALATGGFIDGARTGLLVAAAVALLGAVVAWRHLPPGGIATPPRHDGTARRRDDARDRRGPAGSLGRGSQLLQFREHVLDEVAGRVAVADIRPYNMTASGLGSGPELRLRLRIHRPPGDHRQQLVSRRYRRHRFVAAERTRCGKARRFEHLQRLLHLLRRPANHDNVTAAGMLRLRATISHRSSLRRQQGYQLCHRISSVEG